MNLTRYTIRTVALLLIPAYLLVQANSVMNRHKHILPDGSVVYHAHPFSKSAEEESKKQHTHTDQELYFFQALSNLVADDPSIDGSFEVFANRSGHFLLQDSEHIQCLFIHDSPNRAPPELITPDPIVST